MLSKNYTQDNPWGCSWYSFASVTGEEKFANLDEEILKDNCFTRFRIRVFKEGYILIPYYVQNNRSFGTISTKNWVELYENIQEAYKEYPDSDYRYKFHLCIESYKYEGLYHSVGLKMLKGTIVIFDPARPRSQYFLFPEFLRSIYSDCYEVWEIYSSDLDEHEPIYTPEELKRKDRD